MGDVGRKGGNCEKSRKLQFSLQSLKVSSTPLLDSQSQASFVEMFSRQVSSFPRNELENQMVSHPSLPHLVGEG